MAAATGPYFESPPVTEVRLSVSFDRLPKVRAAHAGLLWQALGGPDSFPETEDLYLEPAIDETFPASRDRPPFDVALFDRPRPTRTALRSRDRTDSVEIQDDQLTVSWTEQPGSRPYPRYEHIRDRFRRTTESWAGVAQEHGLGVVRPRQAEIAYVNHLLMGQGWDNLADLAQVLRMQWLPTPPGLVPSVPEDLHLFQRYMLERDGKPFGRLYLSADSARERNGKKALSLSLTVRGQPRESTALATLDVLDEGHRIIINTFVSVTSEEMHVRWGRKS